ESFTCWVVGHLVQEALKSVISKLPFVCAVGFVMPASQRFQAALHQPVLCAHPGPFHIFQVGSRFPRQLNAACKDQGFQPLLSILWLSSIYQRPKCLARRLNQNNLRYCHHRNRPPVSLDTSFRSGTQTTNEAGSSLTKARTILSGINPGF